MKKLFCLLIIVNAALLVNAQTVKDSVVKTITAFFKGMYDADTTLLKSTISANAVLQTISNANGKITVTDEKIVEFVSFVGEQKKGDADERIELGHIEIDEDLASVWTPYKFYYKGKFSHCGVNSFQLVRIDEQWKVQFIIDTRRKNGCE